MELWCDLPAELSLNRYQISTLGRVENKQTRIILKTSLKDGYHRLGLVHDDGKRKAYYVHRLVALTFIPNPENKPQCSVMTEHGVNHKNHNRADNNIWNGQHRKSKIFIRTSM